MSETGRWSDLGDRIGVGAIVAAIGLIAIWLGGWLFAALTIAIAGIIVWELVRMLDAHAPAMWIGAGSALALGVAILLPPGYSLPLILAPVFVGFALMDQHRATFSIFAIMILVAGFGLYVLRADFGLIWMFWLVLVVMATDVVGYFAGRFIGGPLFWPRISPKKTWSGTVAGWVGAAFVGVAFLGAAGGDFQIVSVSIAISMSSQMGDVAESAVKRRVGVKDSSSLLPGHGGLFDRFDGMLGAVVFLLLVAQIIDFPPVGV